MFFAQAVGRFVRSRTRGETASVFLPTVPILMGHAAEMEAERDHAPAHRRPKGGDEETGLDESLIEQANRPEQTSDQLEMTFEALESEASVRSCAVVPTAASTAPAG